jgi:iron complex transport system ATP-binding protein
VIEAAGLGFSYGTRVALEAVALRVAAGEVVGLAGPNGSGKSTLIRVLSGVLPGYRGSARIATREVREWSRRDLARAIAVVPQEPVFGFPFSVLEVVLMGRHPHLAGPAFESPADLGLAREALDRCGATELAGRSVQELSAGERQRVVFARALCQNTRTLLLDEPAAFLDIRHQVDLYDIVRELAHASGVAVLTALHDLNLAGEYCDRIYLLREGRSVYDGPPETILTRERLAEVFSADVHVERSARTGRPFVVPLSSRLRSS